MRDIMATDTAKPQEAPSQALQPTLELTPLVSAPLHQRIAALRGTPALFLIAALRHPDAPLTKLAELVGVVGDTPYVWFPRYPGLRDLYEEIKAHAGDLKSEYAQAAMREAIPGLVDKMVSVGQTDGRDAQRARERILETVGVLRKDGDLPEGTESFDMIALRIRRNIVKP